MILRVNIDQEDAMVLRIVDIETTGTDPEKDRIIEIASIDITKEHTHANAMETLVDPGIPIPAQSSAVHHLLDEDVKGAPLIATAIQRFVGADVLVAHNAQFEYDFLAAYFPAAKWVCTYKCALRIWPDAPKHSNQALRYMLGIINPFGVPREKIIAHRAMADVLVTGEIFIEMLKKGVKFSDMLAWSAEPPLMTKFGFGKHKGVPLAETPADYLEWIVHTSDLSEDVKYWCRLELENRRKAA